ncbi:MAG: glycosyl hydrolase, partial [Candidatus Nomurabacteria bacterium]|nr:glycosyl hydrolase [Candidatus Nomurabacteria bacterium]
MTKLKFGAQILPRGSAIFTVWIAGASGVEAVLADADFTTHSFNMSEIQPEIWQVKIPQAAAGMAYQFKATRPDGAVEFYNDPYARQLTASTGGMSVLADGDFDWENDADFTPPARQNQIIYELHLGTFNPPDESTPGTFESALEKLDYLKNLGVNMIEILPVSSMLDGEGWGYAPTNLFAVEENYGGHLGLKNFIKAVHQAGLGVIVDVVYNHLHPSANLPDQFYFQNNFRDTPWGPRLDFTKSLARQYLCDNVEMWLNEYHCDGLRMDFTLGIRQHDITRDDLDNEVPGGWELLRTLTDFAHKIKPAALMIAEDNGANDFLTKQAVNGGAGFDAQWNVELPRVARTAFGCDGNASLDDLAKELNRFYNGQWLQKICFTESHDTAALSNGNRRLAADFDSKNPQSAKARAQSILACGLALTAPGEPMLFQGQEICQGTGWSARDPFDWTLPAKFPGVVQAVRDLINLRLNKFDNTPGLTGGQFQIFQQDNSGGVLAFTRGQTVVIMNLGEQKFADYEMVLPPDFSGRTLRARFNSTWRGYSPDFAESFVDVLKPDASGKITLPLTPFELII